MVVLAKVVPMQAVSVETGNTPLSQFVTVVHWLSPAVPTQLMLPVQASCGSPFGKPESIATTPPPEGTLRGAIMGPVLPPDKLEEEALFVPEAVSTEDCDETATGFARGKSEELDAPPKYAEPLALSAMPRPSSAPVPPRYVENRSVDPLLFRTARNASW